MVVRCSRKLVGLFVALTLVAASSAAFAQADGGNGDTAPPQDTADGGTTGDTGDTSTVDTAPEDTGGGGMDADTATADTAEEEDTGTPPADTGDEEDTGGEEDTGTPPADTGGGDQDADVAGDVDAADAEPSDIGPLDSEVTCACRATDSAPLPGSMLLFAVVGLFTGIARRRD